MYAQVLSIGALYVALHLMAEEGRRAGWLNRSAMRTPSPRGARPGSMAGEETRQSEAARKKCHANCHEHGEMQTELAMCVG